MKFRDLNVDEIECRIAQVKSNGVMLLLYKDARCDMKILDETVGQENWQRDHKEYKGNLFCGIGIWDKTNSQWVWKWDCGAESFSDKEKGEASDSFKRAGFNWGIGRELYTAPFVWIPAELCNIKDGKCYDRFNIKSIEIKDKKITDLEISLKNKVVFSTKERLTQTTTDTEIKDKLATEKEIEKIRRLLKAETEEKTDANVKAVLKRIGKDSTDGLMMTEYVKVINEIKKIKESQQNAMKGVL